MNNGASFNNTSSNISFGLLEFSPVLNLDSVSSEDDQQSSVSSEGDQQSVAEDRTTTLRNTFDRVDIEDKDRVVSFFKEKDSLVEQSINSMGLLAKEKIELDDDTVKGLEAFDHKQYFAICDLLDKKKIHNLNILLVPYQKSVLSEVIMTNNIKQFDGFDIKNNIYRLLMDGDLNNKVDLGEQSFEDEKGYLRGMLNGLILILNSHGKAIDADDIAELHDACVGAVKKDAAGREDMPQGYRDGYDGRILMTEGYNYNNQGITEFKARNAGQFEECEGVFIRDIFDRAGNKGTDTRDSSPLEVTQVAHKWSILSSNNNANKYGLIINPKSADDIKASVAEILAQFYSEMRKINGKGDESHVPVDADSFDQQRLESIVRCTQRLEQEHPFPDGNLRTFAFLLMNKLLLDSGMTPCIIERPNMFDGYDTQSLITEVKKGQQKFQSFCHQVEGVKV